MLLRLDRQTIISPGATKNSTQDTGVSLIDGIIKLALHTNDHALDRDGKIVGTRLAQLYIRPLHTWVLPTHCSNYHGFNLDRIQTQQNEFNLGRIQVHYPPEHN